MTKCPINKTEEEIPTVKVFANWKYSTVKIEINLPNIKNMNLHDVEIMLIREFRGIIKKIREGESDHD